MVIVRRTLSQRRDPVTDNPSAGGYAGNPPSHRPIPSAPPLVTEDLLIQYVRRALEAIESGEHVDPAELCKEHPEYAEPVAEALGLRSGLAEVHRVAEETDPFVGRVLGDRYRLEDSLGRGAMGIVYRAFDQELERTVAVKLFWGGPGQLDDDRERFIREAKTLASVEHEHVVRVHDRGATDRDELYVVMECLSGRPLSSILIACADHHHSGASAEFGEWSEPLFGETHPRSAYLRTVVKWLAEVASGLQSAHERGVFHRDVKPSNIFIRDDLAAVLIDFGIATRSGDAALTATNTGIGTPWYMAPEQVRGRGREEPTTDVYAVCATLYHMLALRPPYDGTAAQVFSNIEHLDPMPIAKVCPSLPRDLVAILDRGMERDPRRRYPTMAALEADLRAFLEHRPVSVRPLTGVGRWWRRAQRRPARALAVVAIAVLVPVAIVATWLGLDTAETARRERVREIVRALPMTLAVEGNPKQRVTFDPAQRDARLARLDELLALTPNDATHRVYRAALRLDAGRHEDAKADATIVARQRRSPYVDAWANVYCSADPTKPGVLSLELSGLPEPSSAFDRFVAGFLELRARSDKKYPERAAEHLGAAAADFPPARALRLVALGAQAERQQSVVEEMFREADAVAAALGHDTARTLAAKGIALIFRRNPRDAIALLEQSDALCPDQYLVVLNLAICHRKLAQLDEATRYLVLATRIRPLDWRLKHTLATVHMNKATARDDPAEFDLADEVARQIPPESSQARWMRANLLGLIARNRANLSDEFREQLAADAVAHFDDALAAAPASRHARIRLNREAAEAVRTGAWRDAAIAMLDLLALSPEADDPYAIANLAMMVGWSELDGEIRDRLQAYLLRLSWELAPGDKEFRARQWAELVEVVQKGR